MDRGFLAWAAVIAFIVVGILLLTDTVTIKTALAIDSFALAAWAASWAPWIDRRP